MRGYDLFAACAALVLLAPDAAAVAQPYPNRPIRQIVPYASGSAADALARVAGDKLAEVLGQPVVIDMRPGANSILGAEAAARAPADGYTFVQLNDAASTLNIALYPKLPYNTLKDFAPLTRAGSIAMVLVVNPAVPVARVEELLAWARAGHDINFGSGGIGSAQHVLMEMLSRSAGLRLTHVPYRGVIPAMNDVIAGHIPVMIVGLAGSLGAIRSGLLPRDRHDRPQARRRAAGRADDRREGPRRIPGRALDRVLRAGGNARAHPRAAQRRSGRSVERRRRAREAQAGDGGRDQHARGAARHGRA